MFKDVNSVWEEGRTLCADRMMKLKRWKRFKKADLHNGFTAPEGKARRLGASELVGVKRVHGSRSRNETMALHRKSETREKAQARAPEFESLKPTKKPRPQREHLQPMHSYGEMGGAWRSPPSPGPAGLVPAVGNPAKKGSNRVEGRD